MTAEATGVSGGVALTSCARAPGAEPVPPAGGRSASCDADEPHRPEPGDPGAGPSLRSPDAPAASPRIVHLAQDADRVDGTADRVYNVTLEDGRVMHVVEFGPALGRPVVYCHGWPGCGMEARLFKGSATNRGIRLICPDRPGQGGSSTAAAQPLSAWSDDLVQLLDVLNLQRASLLAFSGGGAFALAGAARLGERIEKVVALGAVCPGPWGPLTRGMYPVNRLLFILAQRVPLVLGLCLAVMSLMLRVCPRLFVGVLLWLLTREERRVLGEPSERSRQQALWQRAFSGGFRGPWLEVLAFQSSWGEGLARIRVPVTLWHAQEDRNVPLAMARALEAAIRTAKVLVVPGQGHHSLAVRRGAEIVASL